MNYTFPPRPVGQMEDAHLRIGSLDGDKLQVFASFDGSGKQWPPVLTIDRFPFAFVQQNETDVDETRYGACATYILSPTKGH